MADDNSRNTLVTSTRSLLHDPASPPPALADPGLEKISPDSDGGTRKRSWGGRPAIAESERESNASRWSGRARSRRTSAASVRELHTVLPQIRGWQDFRLDTGARADFGDATLVDQMAAVPHITMQWTLFVGA